ncbi:hypothetical protein ABI_40490 [Asticcacaulis biprosthecium C19]|uniref:Uncharacterized protein n=1 Tax=Asticcacaulis biprosthecium C19 TaxID=715226 RepID=F4QSA6_9CAUL|nr:hypothetical protein ABI_40490 [Asticcacaulis biprosthecium C19]
MHNWRIVKSCKLNLIMFVTLPQSSYRQYTKTLRNLSPPLCQAMEETSHSGFNFTGFPIVFDFNYTAI